MLRAKLQPLRIPTGWHVKFNDGLYELDPDETEIPDDEYLIYFKEDMFQAVHPGRNRLVDLGWYPEGDRADGHYTLELYEGDFLGRLLHRVETRDRVAIVDSIESILLAVCNGDNEFGPYPK